jgi:hypothetical protein
MTRVLTALTLALTALPAAAPAAGQDGVRRLEILTEGGDGQPLYRVRAAAFRGGDLAVLTDPEPAVHVYRRGGSTAWGWKGRGPAELTNPRGIAWHGDAVLVRDADLRKIASFGADGTLRDTRPFPLGMVTRLDFMGRDTVLELFSLDVITVVRLRGERADTLLRFTPPSNTVNLSAPGSPSLTLTAPFAARPLWTALPDGRVAHWRGEGRWLDLLDATGTAVLRLQLPDERHAVTAADREEWLDSGFPVHPEGRHIFEPLREKARAEVPFPGHFPAAMALMADPRGGVWVMQTPASQGQRWVYVAEGEPLRRLRLPRGQTLLAVGRDTLAVHATDELGAESVHLYGRAQGRGRR